MGTDWFSVDTPFQTERLELAWPDAPTDSPELCDFILTTAKEQVITFAPPEIFVPEEENFIEDPPGSGAFTWVSGQLVPLPPGSIAIRLVLAQLQQAKSIWNAGRGEVGADGFSFLPRPLEKEIQQMIRPRRGVPNVF